MGRSIIFASQAWEQYLYWQTQDKKILRKINSLIKESQRDPFAGTGKPEALVGDLSGFWSRRIDGAHRLVYAVTDTEINIASCRFHYGD